MGSIFVVFLHCFWLKCLTTVLATYPPHNIVDLCCVFGPKSSYKNGEDPECLWKSKHNVYFAKSVGQRHFLQDQVHTHEVWKTKLCLRGVKTDATISDLNTWVEVFFTVVAFKRFFSCVCNPDVVLELLFIGVPFVALITINRIWTSHWTALSGQIWVSVEVGRNVILSLVWIHLYSYAYDTLGLPLIFRPSCLWCILRSFSDGNFLSQFLQGNGFSSSGVWASAMWMVKLSFALYSFSQRVQG